MDISLKSGLWRPQFWFSGVLSTSGGVRVVLPTQDAPGLDSLINETGRVVVVRSLTFETASAVYHGDDPYSLGAAGAGFRLETSILRKGGRTVPLQNAPLFAPPVNGIRGNTGNALTNGARVLPLAAPARVDPGGVLNIRLQHGPMTWFYGLGPTTNNSVTKRFTLHGRGVVSGRVFTWGIQPSSSDEINDAFVNTSTEPVDITSLTCNASKVGATLYGLYLYLQQGDHTWMRGPRPMWMYSQPGAFRILDLSRLPEGGLVLAPGDGLRLDGRDTRRDPTTGAYVTDDLYMIMAAEAYVQVSS